MEENLNIEEDTTVPGTAPGLLLAVHATWEIDIWKKLRNAKKTAFMRYMATVEGKNFMVTNLIAEIADTYYELLALDNQLVIVRRTSRSKAGCAGRGADAEAGRAESRSWPCAGSKPRCFHTPKPAVRHPAADHRDREPAQLPGWTLSAAGISAMPRPSQVWYRIRYSPGCPCNCSSIAPM